MWGNGVYLGVSHSSHLQRGEFQRFLTVLGRSLYLCLHPVTLNDQIQHGNEYGESRVFMSSATPVFLHKCLARFVSDSSVSCSLPSSATSTSFPIVVTWKRLYGAT